MVPFSNYYKSFVHRKLDLFSTWEDHQIQEVSDMSRIEDYNHDSVIVKDSTENEWILFVAKVRKTYMKRNVTKKKGEG